MGYYTSFSLKTEPPGWLEEILANETLTKQLEEYSGYMPWAVTDGGDSCKWYQHEEEMIEISRLYPDVLFILHGEGEDNDDVWDAWALNGQYEEAKYVMIAPPRPVWAVAT